MMDESNNKIGRGKRMDVREFWKIEPKFTKWLGIQENMDILSEQIGLNLESLKTEKQIGNFKADNFVEVTDSDKRAIIENKFGSTDHSHLGKAITYKVNLEAKTIIWIITEKANPEHVKTVNWLNEITPEDESFYLVRMDLWSIDDSRPHPIFTVIVSPSSEVKQIGERKKEASKSKKLKEEFREALAKAGVENTISVPNIRSMKFHVGKRQYESGVDLQWSSDTDKLNEAYEIFDELERNKEKIEKETGHLIWKKGGTGNLCKISLKSKLGGYENVEHYDKIIADLKEKMYILKKTLEPYLNKFKK